MVILLPCYAFAVREIMGADGGGGGCFVRVGVCFAVIG